MSAVIPVLSAAPGTDSSVVATVLADALQFLAWRVLLVDTAAPVRLGLARAAQEVGSTSKGPHEAVRIRRGRRGRAVIAHLETQLTLVPPELVPPPPFWIPADDDPPHVTVVDLAADAWWLSARPLAGGSAWLRRGWRDHFPVLVVHPTRRSLAHAEEVLARLESWPECVFATDPASLVVVGAKRWPDGVANAAGRRVSTLVNHAVFLPYDSRIAMGGIGPQITSARLHDAVMPLLRSWRLVPHDRRGEQR